MAWHARAGRFRARTLPEVRPLVVVVATAVPRFVALIVDTRRVAQRATDGNGGNAIAGTKATTTGSPPWYILPPCQRADYCCRRRAGGLAHGRPQPIKAEAYCGAEAASAGVAVECCVRFDAVCCVVCTKASVPVSAVAAVVAAAGLPREFLPESLANLLVDGRRPDQLPTDLFALGFRKRSDTPQLVRGWARRC
jgi:hypothetical protein